MQPRPPIVVVLGHVDHGKTTLLDAIRSTNVATKEYGGITQKIGAHQITLPATSHQPLATITFIDTPGHEAFTKMRSRGTKVADIAVLVVAANDSVMPQTIESIKTIQDAKIPYIVAINKMDLPEANVDRVIQDLLRHGVLLENYGGDVPFVKVSAKKKEGVKELLDLITLLAQVSGVSGNPDGPLEMAVIESKMDKNRGWVVTVIIRNGTLKVGQEISSGKIRALVDYQGKNILQAGPGTPVEILGLRQDPIAEISPSQNADLNLILKADTNGSLEAIQAKIPDNVNLLSSGTGEITDADVLFAKSTKAIILGFNVKLASPKLAETEKVLVRTYKIIYELLDELEDAAKGALVPPVTEEVLGTAEIIAEFPFEKLRVCGTKVTDGRLARGDLIKIQSQKSKIKSIRVGKDDVNRVEKGKECGVLLDPQIDFGVGDDIIAYRVM